MDLIREYVRFAADLLGNSTYFPYLLVGVGVFFTIYLGFPQLRYFIHAWKVLSGKYESKDAEGDTTHFQALTTALSGTVGTGNIAGVGFAIFLGGPAALFWMWVTAFVGMATKFVEVTLSHKYRIRTTDGTIAGGPMYYMERKLGQKWLAVLFALATVTSSFGTGSLPQINSIASAMYTTFSIPHMLTGGVLAVVMFSVIVGGIKRIAHFTQNVVPAMALLYTVGVLGVIMPNLDKIGPAFLSIFEDAFTGTAAVGGFLGASFSFAFTRGVNRGLYSNEAGQGSAPIAHASAKGDDPVAEGMVSILEPFIDTIVICTITGLVILSSGVWTEKFENDFQRTDTLFLQGFYDDAVQKDRAALHAYLSGEKGGELSRLNGSIDVVEGRAVKGDYTILHARSVAEDVRFYKGGKLFSGSVDIEEGMPVDITLQLKGKSLLHTVQLTSMAFSEGWFGAFGPMIIAIGLLLFAFSTAVAWSYYGDRAMVYLFGIKAVVPYRIVYCIAFFLASFVDTTLIWDIASVTIALMAIPNLFGIVTLHKDMKTAVSHYWENFNKRSKDG